MTQIVDISREEVVLRRIFDDPVLQGRIVHILDKELFDNPLNKAVCHWIVKYYGKYSKFPTSQTLVASLPECGERNQIIKIQNFPMEQIDREAAVELVETFFVEQKTRIILTSFAESIHNRDFSNISDLIKKLQDSVNFTLTIDVGIDGVEDVEEAMMRLNQTVTAIPSSMEAIRVNTSNHTSSGGWYRNALSVMLGMPNVGKSIMLCNEAAYAYMAGYNVCYVTLELAEELVWERFAVNVTDIPLHEIRGTDPQHVKQLIIDHKNENAESCGEIIIKKLPSTTTVNELNNLVKEIKRAKGIDIDLLVVDYIGIMKPAKTSTSFSQHSLYTSGKEIAEQLRDLANIYGFAVLTASQFTRDGYENNQASMKNTAGSAGINDTADFMITITQDPMLKTHKMFFHTILKSRFGPNTISFITKVDYHHMRVRDATHQDIDKYNQANVDNELTISDFSDNPNIDSTKTIAKSSDAVNKSKEAKQATSNKKSKSVENNEVIDKPKKSNIVIDTSKSEEVTIDELM